MQVKAVYSIFSRGGDKPDAAAVEFVPVDGGDVMREDFQSVEDERFRAIVLAWPWPIFREVEIDAGGLVICPSEAPAHHAPSGSSTVDPDFGVEEPDVPEPDPEPVPEPEPEPEE